MSYKLLFSHIVKHLSVSVVGLVIPWNYPLMMLAWKMGACLAAGNTMVLKPAKVLKVLWDDYVMDA